MNDEEYFYRENKSRRIRQIITGVVTAAVILIAGYFFVEWLLTSMGLQAAPAGFAADTADTAGEPEEEFVYGHVASWNGEKTDNALSVLPEYEITVEDYRMKGLSRVGRPSATQERLSTDLFIVVNDDEGELVMTTMSNEGVYPQRAATLSVLVRDHPTDWQTLKVFDPVTVTITVPDDLAEDAFVDNLVVYAVYSRQYPDNPGGLATLPVSVSEEDGLCYVSFLVREEYESVYALCTK